MGREREAPIACPLGRCDFGRSNYRRRLHGESGEKGRSTERSSTVVRHLLEEQARKDAEAISTFLSEVFQSPDPTRDGREIKVVELLDKAAEKLETDLAAMQARVDLHSGQPADAYELLASTLSSRRSTRSAETYALLAVAAFEAGKDDAFEDAVARASELDADMQELVEAAHERQLASQ